MTLSIPCELQGRQGRYRIGGVLGQGGMSAVYWAKSDRGQDVVVKEASGADVALCEERLRIEAQILRSLGSPGHPRIVHYVDEGSNLGTFCLVEEKLDGETLAERHRNKPADEATARRYTLELLDALNYLHGRNVLHRDIKPKNIILDAHRGLVLIDFGGAKKEFHQFAGPGTIVFTPGWAAPEQNLGEATPASDLYGAGAVLFFLLTAQDPQHSMKQLPQGGGELFRSPRDLEPSVSQELSDVVTKAMAFDPKQRFVAAQDMIEAITKGHEARLGVPHVVLLGKKHKLVAETEIGRGHQNCNKSCTTKGFGHPPDIAIPDAKKFLSKHHAKISKDRHGRCWIQDLGSLNGTAISHDGGRTYRPISVSGRQRLTDGDVVALVYKPGKGPYMTFAFKSA